MKFKRGWGLSEKTFSFSSDELKFIIEILEYVKLNSYDIPLLNKILDEFKKGE